MLVSIYYNNVGDIIIHKVIVDKNNLTNGLYTTENNTI